MKELVEKLASEAQLVQADNADRAWTTEMCDGVLPATLERFAKLVAQECGRACDGLADEASALNDPAASGWLHTAADAIRERFGIKEG